MTAEDDYAAELSRRLYSEVGAFFCNTQRGTPGICAVCTGPATTPLCPQCRHAREAFGSDLADLVVPLAYAKGRMSPMHQSEHHVYSYKRQPPALKCVKDLKLMMAAATWLHGGCIASKIEPWQVVTFVPSANRPVLQHPVKDLASQVCKVYPEVDRIVLDIGQGYDNGPHRAPRRDRFTVPYEYRSTIEDRHVLLVDDTWVSGDKSQSAALALKTVGAACVTILCTTRWLRYDWADHRTLIDTLREPFDAMRCPVTGTTCPI